MADTTFGLPPGKLLGTQHMPLLYNFFCMQEGGGSLGEKVIILLYNIYIYIYIYELY